MTTYNIYAAYNRARLSGRRNIRFISLVDRPLPRNPVTDDTGHGLDRLRGHNCVTVG